jgi:hypothetical protein
MAPPEQLTSHRVRQLPVQMLAARQVPRHSESSSQSNVQNALPALQSMLHAARSVHPSVHVVPLAQVILQSLMPLQLSRQAPVVQVKLHDCRSLQVQVGPHSPLVGDGPPVSGTPLSFGVTVPESGGDSITGASAAPPASVLPLPIVQLNEQPTATSATTARLQTRRMAHEA